MKGITYCGACADYDLKKHRCKRGAMQENNPQDSFFDDCPLPTVVYEEIKTKYETLKRFVDGEWVDCHSVQDALEIDFSTGLNRFDFRREVEWNPAPLNGQKITTKFRLKQDDKRK